jgi:hypothetical protein
LTGNCGPNAYNTLAAAGLQVIVGASGTVRDVVEQFKSGAFAAASGANVQSHFGVGAGMGGGRGMGMGRGMGRGMGGGMMPQTGPQPMNPEQEIEMLKSQAQTLGQQLDEIQRRLEELEKGG